MNTSSQNNTQPDIIAGTSYTLPLFVLTVIISGYTNDSIKEAILETHEAP
jgi:hypothetical protein